ncbi:MAG: glutathione S-transferase family protein [bacterium]
MYTVIGTARTRTARVLWLLEELGQPYDHRPFAPQSAEVAAHNPSGKVPVLIADGVTLTDSFAILTYLADKHGQFTCPAGSLDRARQDGFSGLILDELEGLLWTSSRHSFVLPPDLRLAEIKVSLKWEFERNQARLADRMAGPFVMGDQMTVPDILLAHCLSWAKAAKFPEVDPRLADYHTRMLARPAWTRVLAR